jgi:hypothetical protein
MSITLDYARVYETEVRRRTPLRRAAALTVWAGLFLVRPRLAVAIWRERRAR